MIASRRWPRNTWCSVAGQPKEDMPWLSGPRCAIARSAESSVSIESMLPRLATHPAIPHIQGEEAARQERKRWRESRTRYTLAVTREKGLLGAKTTLKG